MSESEISQEDDHLLALGQMNVRGFYTDELISGGLSFDDNLQRSDDFTIIYRYGSPLWEVDWLRSNRIFAWHVDTRSDLILKVDEICSLTIGEIKAQMDVGNNLFKTIRS